MVEIPQRDLEDLLISTVRYALVGMNYIVFDTCWIVRELWPEIGADARDVIERDLRWQIEAGGVEADAPQWRDLLQWIRRQK